MTTATMLSTSLHSVGLDYYFCGVFSNYVEQQHQIKLIDELTILILHVVHFLKIVCTQELVSLNAK